jgi:hypothetical protein
MATIFWDPKATAVAQVDTVEITAYDVATTYILTVNGEQVVSLIGQGGTVTTTAAAAVVLWNASTSPYCTGITASNASGVITLTADTAGEPNTVTSSKSGGTGTIGSVTSVTAATGPNDWNNAVNFSGGAIPANTNDVVVDNTNQSILFGLDQSGMSGTLNSFTVGAGFTGKIGLNRNKFLTAGAEAAGAGEYREDYLKIECDGVISISDDSGTGVTLKSQRIKIDNGANAATFRVFSTADLENSADNPRPPVQLLSTSASSTLYAKSGFVGVAVAVPGETATFGTINSAGARIITGNGLTLTTFVQSASGGATGAGSSIRAAGTITTMTINGGTVETSGSFAITTVNCGAGEFVSNSTGTITNLNSTGGSCNFIKSKEARTVTTPLIDAPGSIAYDPSVVTLTNKVTSNNPVNYSATSV